MRECSIDVSIYLFLVHQTVKSGNKNIRNIAAKSGRIRSFSGGWPRNLRADIKATWEDVNMYAYKWLGPMQENKEISELCSWDNIRARIDTWWVLENEIAIDVTGSKAKEMDQ